MARATSSRGASSSVNRRPPPSSSSAPSPRSASVSSRPEPISAVGWNCTSSRPGQRRARPVGHRHTVAHGPRRIRRARPERGRAARCEQRRAGGDGAARADGADHAPVEHPQAAHRFVLDDLDARVRHRALTQSAGDRMPRVRALGVHDPAARVPALEPEALVEGHAELDEIGDARRSLVGQRANGARTAEPRPTRRVSV